MPNLEGKILTSSRCISNNEGYKEEDKAPKGKLDKKDLPLEDTISFIDNLVTKRDLQNLKEVINRLMDVRLSSLKTELERKIMSREVLEGRSSDSCLVERLRRTIDENESENAEKDIRAPVEFKSIKLQKDSSYTKLNNELREILGGTAKQLKDQENSIDQLKKRCEKLERNNRNNGPDKKEQSYTKETDKQLSTLYESIRTELNSFKDSFKKSQVEIKKRLDQLESNIKFIQSTTQNQIKSTKTFLTKLKEDITLQILNMANSLKANTQEVLLKLNNNLKENLNQLRNQNKHLTNKHDTYQEPQDISHKMFCEEGIDFYQDNRELVSIMNLEESIAKSDAENFDEVRNMIANNLVASNFMDNKTTYEDDKALFKFIRGPTMKEDQKEYEGKFIVE